MFEFKPEKLFVDFKNGITNTGSAVPRAYTMTHSDETADLFVTIGSVYDSEKITEKRDEVLGEWVKEDGEYKVKVYVHVDGQNGEKETAIRNEIFRREMPLALSAIRYADKEFFKENSTLDKAPITVYFNSIYEKYNKKEDWGVFEQYATCGEKFNKKEDELSKKTSETRGKVKSRDRKKEKNKGKDNDTKLKLQEDVITNFLNPYIQNQIWITYGKIQYFCLSDVEVLSITPVQIQSPCRRKFEVAVGLKVGREPSPYNNMIIEFLVSSNGVTTKSVKNPR